MVMIAVWLHDWAVQPIIQDIHRPEDGNTDVVGPCLNVCMLFMFGIYILIFAVPGDVS